MVVKLDKIYFNALNYLQKKKYNKVLIHDAARPNFSINLIKKF